VKVALVWKYQQGVTILHSAC